MLDKCFLLIKFRFRRTQYPKLLGSTASLISANSLLHSGFPSSSALFILSSRPHISRLYPNDSSSLSGTFEFYLVHTCFILKILNLCLILESFSSSPTKSWLNSRRPSLSCQICWTYPPFIFLLSLDLLSQIDLFFPPENDFPKTRTRIINLSFVAVL